MFLNLHRWRQRILQTIRNVSFYHVDILAIAKEEMFDFLSRYLSLAAQFFFLFSFHSVFFFIFLLEIFLVNLSIQTTFMFQRIKNKKIRNSKYDGMTKAMNEIWWTLIPTRRTNRIICIFIQNIEVKYEASNKNNMWDEIIFQKKRLI